VIARESLFWVDRWLRGPIRPNDRFRTHNCLRQKPD